MRHIRYRNPVHPEYFADPFVWATDGGYLAVGTGRGDAAGTTASRDGPTVFPMLRSPDLVHWRPAGWALVRPDASLGSTFWAPEVAQDGGRWYLYYSVGEGDQGHQIRVAVAHAPGGPYVDAAGLTDRGACPFAIDPHPFRDDDGRWYLFYARDFLDQRDERGRPVRAGTALAVRPLPTMTRVSPEQTTVARARCDWQRFAANRVMYGGCYDWHTLEGPCVVCANGRYFCLFSGGCWQDASYGVDYVVADAVTGPYADDGVAQGPRVLRTVPGAVIGPGHCSVVVGPDRRTRYLAYHAWGPDRSARRLCIDELTFTASGPVARGPSSDDRLVAVGDEGQA